MVVVFIVFIVFAVVVVVLVVVVVVVVLVVGMKFKRSHYILQRCLLNGDGS